MRRELATLGIRTPWAALRAGRNFLRTVWDPTRSDIQHGINTLIHEGLRGVDRARIEQIERERPTLAQLYAEGYDPDIDPKRLEALPDGSLGREYARFIRDNAIDPLGTLLAMGEPTNLAQYLFRRAYKLHDVLHVVLGCDASVLGEVRIVSYSLGQARLAPGAGGRAPALALAVLFLHLALRKPEDVKPAIRLAGEWLALGERARPYTDFRLEDLFERPVSEVRGAVMAAA
jgi:ubiquinone biosynthesis protein Coq4